MAGMRSHRVGMRSVITTYKEPAATVAGKNGKKTI
jgi:hypothetical protein